MVLSQLGIIADVFWHEIPKHSQHVLLGEFVVMPNHVHGILLIEKPEDLKNGGGDGGDVTTEKTGGKTVGKTRFQNQGKNTISSIVGSYKSAVTRHANRLEIENGWQAGFHDHIIRSHGEYDRIEKYISYNPKNWKEDKFHD